MKSPHFAVDYLTSLCYHKNIIDNPEFERRNFLWEKLVYQALMQSVAAFFFAVMILPAVVIFLGYLIYIVVMCVSES